jgi:hypothetical protein
MQRDGTKCLARSNAPVRCCRAVGISPATFFQDLTGQPIAFGNAALRAFIGGFLSQQVRIIENYRLCMPFFELPSSYKITFHF